MSHVGIAPTTLSVTVFMMMTCCLPALAGPTSRPAAPKGFQEGPGLAAKYDHDRGIERDPAVLFADGFESGELRRWDDTDGNSPPAVRVVDVPGLVHTGRKAVQLEVQPGKGVGADLVKLLSPGQDRVYARWYCRFAESFDQGNLMHFVQFWAMRERWQLGRSGEKPDGTDFFCTSLEPWRDWGRNPAPGAMGFYTYYPGMKPDPSGPYYGNEFRPKKPPVIIDRGRWYCMEMMVKANHPEQADGEQVFWIDGKLKGRYTDIRWRTTEKLKINGLWLLLYIHNNKQVNRVWFDDIVVATEYIGPINPDPDRALDKAPVTREGGAR
ncbi:MAG TPA: hypothetical protein PKY77_22930 [Phycisphaerae bacterium]|nr:hypothetical protein [Phycisphaerae bacterium]HRY71288.1 hypothetical protein [Phycisphaerae bacterium]HSA29764.1 hypothetical protein [Phycisphaerae bacterium]